MTYVDYTLIRLNLKEAYDELRPLMVAEHKQGTIGPVRKAIASLAIISEKIQDISEFDEDSHLVSILAVDVEPSMN